MNNGPKLNEIRVAFYPDKRLTKTCSLFQYDYGQVLYLAGFPLTKVFEVHFSHYRTGESTAVIGENERVQIPDIYLTSGKPIYCWLYLHSGSYDGKTVYEIHIPVVERPGISSEPPTPVQQDLIDTAIAKLNDAVEYTTVVKEEIQALIDIFDPTSTGALVIVDGGDASQADWEHEEEVISDAIDS